MQYPDAVHAVMTHSIIKDMVEEGDIAGLPTVDNLLPHTLDVHEAAAQGMQYLGVALRSGDWEETKTALDELQGTLSCLAVLVNARETLARAVLADAVAVGMPTMADFKVWSMHSPRGAGVDVSML